MSALRASLARIGVGVLGAALLLALVLVAVDHGVNGRIVDFDELWHLASGRYMLETGTVPSRDPFTFTAGDTPWTNMHWLGQVVVYAVYRVGGIELDWLLGHALWLGAVALACERARRRAKSPLGVLPGTFLVLLALARASLVRPQSWSFFLLALALLLADAVRTNPRWAIGLGVLLAVNGQLHGGFVFAFTATGILAVSRAFDAWRAGERPREALWLLAALAAGMLAFALHPQHFRALVYPLGYAFDPRLKGMEAVTSEHMQPVLSGPIGKLIELPLLLLFAGLATGRARFRTEDVLVTGAFAHLALLQSRGLHLFAIVAAAPLALATDALLESAADLRPWLARAKERLEEAGRIFARFAPVALAVALVGIGGFWAPRLHAGVPGDTSSPLLATHADEFEVARALATRPGRCFNAPEEGGALLWTLYPRPVFMDSRGDLHALTGAFEDYETLWLTRPGWEAVLDRRGCDLALVRHGVRLDTALRARGWTSVHENATYALLARSKHE